MALNKEKELGPEQLDQTPHLDVRLAAHVSNGWKSLIHPSSGKDTSKDKSVHREVESEESRMANLRSDEQKSHQATVKDKVAQQAKVQ